MRQLRKAFRIAVLLVGAALGCHQAIATEPAAAQAVSGNEERLFSGLRQLIFQGRRSGEGYFSADGSLMIFQSEREPDNPFYQMYLMDLETGDTRRVSPGHGKTTCGWIHPDGDKVLFASSHEDPQARAKQAEEIEKRARGQGIGTALMQRALEHAASLEAHTVELTSRPARAAANSLYQRLGFVQRNTNGYCYEIA